MEPLENSGPDSGFARVGFDGERPYHVLGGLFLPDPSACGLSMEHLALAQFLRTHLQALHDRDLEGIDRPLKSLQESYIEFKAKELRSWTSVESGLKLRDTLVRASGSLDSPLAHHLIQPSYTTLKLQDDSETADETNGCTAMVMGNLWEPATLVFDHVHRRSVDSKGLETLPEPVLNCHEHYSKEISDSMAAKVELLHGRQLQNRILSKTGCAYDFTTLRLWGDYEGVTLFLSHESNHCNADTRYLFRRICIFVMHPNKIFYEPANSALMVILDKSHIAASAMTGVPVIKYYFRQRQFVKLTLNPCRSMIIKKRNQILDELEQSNSTTILTQTNSRNIGTTSALSSAYSQPAPQALETTRGEKSDLQGKLQGQVNQTQTRIRKKVMASRKNPRCGSSRFAHSQALLQIQSQITVKYSQALQPFPRDPRSPQAKADRNLLRVAQDGNPPTLNEDKEIEPRSGSDCGIEESVWTASADRSTLATKPRCDQRTGRTDLDNKSIQQRVSQPEVWTGAWVGPSFKTLRKEGIVNPIPNEYQMELSNEKLTQLYEKLSPRLPFIDEMTEKALPGTSPTGDTQTVSYCIRNLNLVKVDDMDCATRHDRLRTFKKIIERGDELTEIEEAQYVELKAKGTRVHGRDLSKMDVADMTSKTRSVRRTVLKKKNLRHEVLNRDETMQWENLGRYYRLPKVKAA